MFGTRSRVISTVPINISKRESKSQTRVTLEIKGASNIAYKKEVNVFIDGTIEDLIKTVEDIEKITMSNNTDKAKKDDSWFHYYTMAFEGSALHVFLTKYNDLKNLKMMDNAETECLIAVLNRFFPVNALFLQKSYLRRDMKKHTICRFGLLH